MLSKCPKCEKPIPEGAKFCEGCGADLAVEENKIRAQQLAQAEAHKINLQVKQCEELLNRFEVEERFKTNRVMSGLLAFGGLILGGVAGISIYNLGGSTENALFAGLALFACITVITQSRANKNMIQIQNEHNTRQIALLLAALLLQSKRKDDEHDKM